MYTDYKAVKCAKLKEYHQIFSLDQTQNETLKNKKQIHLCFYALGGQLLLE